MKRQYVRVDADALSRVGASPVLALHLGVRGTVALAAEEPEARATLGDPDSRVAMMTVMGPLAQRAVADLCAYIDGYDAISARFELAMEADTDGVLMVFDSPGGDVAGLEAAIDRMRAAKERAGKPVVAFVDELAASAAYWLAASLADEIVTPEAGQIGSIGAIGAVVDLTEQQRQMGASWTVMRDPPGKAEAMPYAPIDDLARERLKTLVESAAQRFIGGVAHARGLSGTRIRALNGEVLSGTDAVRFGLADRIGTMAEAASLVGSYKQRKRERMKVHTALCAALALDESSTDAEVVEAVKIRLNGDAAKIAALTETADAYKAKAARVDALEAEVASLKSEQTKAEVEAAIEQASKDRKITPAKREEFTKKAHKLGLEWTKSVIEELPVQAGGNAPPPPPAAAEPADHGLSAAEMAACKRRGIDPSAYAAKFKKSASSAVEG